MILWLCCSLLFCCVDARSALRPRTLDLSRTAGDAVSISVGSTLLFKSSSIPDTSLFLLRGKLLTRTIDSLISSNRTLAYVGAVVTLAAAVGRVTDEGAAYLLLTDHVSTLFKDAATFTLADDDVSKISWVIPCALAAPCTLVLHRVWLRVAASRIQFRAASASVLGAHLVCSAIQRHWQLAHKLARHFRSRVRAFAPLCRARKLVRTVESQLFGNTSRDENAILEGMAESMAARLLDSDFELTEFAQREASVAGAGAIRLACHAQPTTQRAVLALAVLAIGVAVHGAVQTGCAYTQTSSALVALDASRAAFQIANLDADSVGRAIEATKMSIESTGYAAAMTLAAASTTVMAVKIVQIPWSALRKTKVAFSVSRAALELATSSPADGARPQHDHSNTATRPQHDQSTKETAAPSTTCGRNVREAACTVAQVARRIGAGVQREQSHLPWLLTAVGVGAQLGEMSVRRALRLLSYSLPIRGNLADLLGQRAARWAMRAARKAAIAQALVTTRKVLTRMAFSSTVARAKLRWKQSTAGVEVEGARSDYWSFVGNLKRGNLTGMAASAVRIGTRAERVTKGLQGLYDRSDSDIPSSPPAQPPPPPPLPVAPPAPQLNLSAESLTPPVFTVAYTLALAYIAVS